MDRLINYPGQIPLETDLLNTNRNTMIALGKLAGAILGTSNNIVNGLAVVPTGPASLSVNVNAGEIYSLQNVDNTAYSSLPADTTDTVVKQGIQLQPVNLSCPAPSTAGFSINYLIEATYQDNDTGSVVLPYYNASNPSQAYSGPNNTGAAQATNRQGKVVLQAKAGIAATTGTQTTPAVDAGYVALAVVTVANGQAAITSGNIAAVTSSQVLTASLLAMIQAAVPLATAITSFTPTVGSTRNARMNITTASATGTFTADQVVVANALNGQSYILSNYSQTLNLATVGAGGMDIGTAPLNGFVAIYAIYNPTTQTASILATNAATLQGNIYGAGHMPAGYTASALLAVWPIGATAVLQIGVQTDRTLAIAANTALASGAAQASFTAVSLAVSVPLNAKSAAGYMACSSTSAGGLTMAISPSNALGTATGIGVNLLQAYGNTTSASMYWRAQLPTPQTIYYTGAAGVGTFGANVTVTEYTI